MTENEKWDYKIEGRSSGALPLVVFGVLSLLFIGLSIAQFVSAKNSASYTVAVLFLSAAVSPVLILVKTTVYYFCFKLFIGKRGFYFQTTPFDGRYYDYGEIKSCGKAMQSQRRRRSSGGGIKTYHFVVFTENNGRRHKFLYDKAMFEREINELIKRAGSGGEPPRANFTAPRADGNFK